MSRPRTTVFARTGYWAFRHGENTLASSPAPAAVPAAVQAALDRLADSLRPDADESGESKRRVALPREAGATPVPGPLTIAPARGRMVGEAVNRREFRRTDTLVIRNALRTPVDAGRLLDRRGRLLTDLPLMPGVETPWLRLALGNLAPGE